MKRLPTDLTSPGNGTFFVSNARILLGIGLALVILAGGASVVMVLKTADADRYAATEAQVRQSARVLFS